MKLLTTIPFAGFYNSDHDMSLEDALNQMFMDEKGDEDSDKSDDAYNDMDWPAAFRLYAKEYTEQFARTLGISMEFESMDSPKEYNFTTDRIFAYIDLEQLTKMRGELPQGVLEKAIKDRFTSRDGFMSSYPNDLADWPENMGEWDHNQVGTLVEAYADHSDKFTSEFDIMESARENGKLDEFLFKASPSLAAMFGGN